VAKIIVEKQKIPIFINNMSTHKALW